MLTTRHFTIVRALPCLTRAIFSQGCRDSTYLNWSRLSLATDSLCFGRGFSGWQRDPDSWREIIRAVSAVLRPETAAERQEADCRSIADTAICTEPAMAI